MRRTLKKFIKQRQLPGFLGHWGAAKITWTHMAIYVNAGTFLMMTATFYHTTAQHWFFRKLDGWTPGYPLFLFAILCVIGLVALFWEFRFSIPSVFRFQQDQLYEHSKVFKGDIKQIIKNTKELREDLDELKGQNEDILRRLESKGYKEPEDGIFK